MNRTLYIVATPIGNLGDITYRAVQTLGAVDLIACEDTRTTAKLLDHYGIRKPLVSYHEHNEAERTQQLLGRLEAGESIALVTDAGTPLISDPGYRIVSEAAARGITVTALPGASAILTTLAASGLPTDAFLFAGFLPQKTTARRKALTEWSALPATLVVYESPHRILESLADIADVLGPRPMVAGRELTKLHEELLRGTPEEVRAALASRPAIKGEFTLAIAKGEPVRDTTESPRDAVTRLIAAGTPRMDAIKQVARERGVTKRDLYRQLEGD